MLWVMHSGSSSESYMRERYATRELFYVLFTAGMALLTAADKRTHWCDTLRSKNVPGLDAWVWTKTCRAAKL
jgi:hypothetical protein